MVVCSRHASFANATVLASSRLQKFACCACIAGVVEYAIVRVVAHLFRMVEGGDVSFGISCRAQIEEEVRLW
jgi:hypothetical protein